MKDPIRWVLLALLMLAIYGNYREGQRLGECL
jgi:hypothetical protein